MKEKREPITITVEEAYDNKRIDKALAALNPDMSRNFIQKLIELGFVFVEGEKCQHKKQKIFKGQDILVQMPEPEYLEIEPEDIDLNIVYEDEDVLVVDKPKGMVVHPAAGNYSGTLVNGIMYHCRDKLSSINGVVRPGIVHRIDKNTSGLLMIAKNDMSHKSLAKQLFEHTVNRRYVAIVYNNFKEDEGTVDKPIGRDQKNRMKQAVTEINSKAAVTHYKVLERFGIFTLIQLELETGRTHQIRVHMAYINHPILGDEVYGPKKAALGAEGQMLHAQVLGFVHPSTGEYMEFFSPLPEEFQRILDELREETR